MTSNRIRTINGPLLKCRPCSLGLKDDNSSSIHLAIDSSVQVTKEGNTITQTYIWLNHLMVETTIVCYQKEICTNHSNHSLTV